MLTLFLDVASHEKSLALVRGDTTVSLVPLPDHTGESELMPLLSRTLKDVGANVTDIGRIAAVTGPGGFMSLRVGIAFANALAWGLAIPLAGVHLSDVWRARVLSYPHPRPLSRGERGASLSEKTWIVEKNAVNQPILTFARSMRKNATDAEKILWTRLRGRPREFIFRRQHPMKTRILDFYCEAAKLGIELDGEYHLAPEQKRYDEERTEAIGEYEIQILRFRNEEVLDDIDSVVNIINKTCRLRTQKTHVSPLPSGEGLGVRGLLWLHSTKKNLVFLQHLDAEGEIVLKTLDELSAMLTTETRFVGELLPEQQAALPLLRRVEATLPLQDILPSIVESLTYERKSLEPWYGRGA